MQVLLIDDDKRITGFMKRGLEAEHYEVHVASTQEESLDLILCEAFDIILLDVFLGQDDGLEVCRIIRQRNVHTPILLVTAMGSLVTAMGSLDIDAEIRRVGANDYLPKPFAFDDLIKKIQDLTLYINGGQRQHSTALTEQHE